MNGEGADAGDDYFALGVYSHRDSYYPHLTTATVKDALERFPLQLVASHDADWLAMAVRRALSPLEREVSEGPERKSNTETRRELQRLGNRIGKLWVTLFEKLSSEADDAIWSHAFRDWVREDRTAETGQLMIGSSSEFDRYKLALNELEWLSGFLRRVARDIPSQAPRWTEAEWREIRIVRAQCLAPIYLKAFGANRLEGPTFGDFYQRIVALVFNEDDIPDFEALIIEARKRHKQQPVVFDPDYIPDL